MLTRGLSPALGQALKFAPAVLIAGARQTGKSTLAQAAAGPDREYISFDEADAFQAARQNPGGFLGGLRGPVILDEVQKVPELFPALKLAIDRDRKPGRFLLTGSANVLFMPRISESLAGRLQILSLGPLTQGEIEGRPESSIDAWFEGDPGRPAAEPRDRLVKRVLRGGFPEAALERPDAERPAWFGSYLATVLSRDIRDLADIERTVDLQRLLALAAARSAGVLNYVELANASGLPQTSLKRYLALLSTLYLVTTLPAWATGAAKSLARRPKLLVTDSGLMAHLLALDASRIAAAPGVFGPILETFVAGELLRQAGWSRTRPRLMHFRDHAGNEVDLVLEDPAGRIVGVEVKSGAASIGAGDLRGLRALAAAARKQFLRGIVLYGGDKVLPLDENVHAVPISGLWKRG